MGLCMFVCSAVLLVRSLLLQTGITSAQHALLLLESVIQKKGKVAIIERVVAEMLQYIGPATKEASGVLKVAAGHSCAAVVAMLLDWSHCEKGQLDLQVCHSLRRSLGEHLTENSSAFAHGSWLA